MNIKRFKLEITNQIQTVRLPKDCWILDFDILYGKLHMNAVTTNLSDEENTRSFLVARDVLTYDINVDDLMYLGSCISVINNKKYFIFEIAPNENFPS
jgi:hypothetical protein